MSTAIDELVAWAKDKNPSLYWRVMRERFQEENEMHFTEDFARYVVGNMYHSTTSGKSIGEHWTIEQVKEVRKRYESDFQDGDNCWDLYVALHVFWHDLGRNYKRTIGEGYEEVMIEDAVTFFFRDEDTQDGKVFRYIEAVME